MENLSGLNILHWSVSTTVHVSLVLVLVLVYGYNNNIDASYRGK